MNPLRIDTGDPRWPCYKGPLYLTNAVILIYCTSNKRQYLSLSNDIFNSDEIYKYEKLYTKNVFFNKYLLIVHISLKDRQR